MAKVLKLSGFKTCGAYQQAKVALSGLTTIFPNRFSVDINERKDKFYFTSVFLLSFSVSVAQ